MSWLTERNSPRFVGDLVVLQVGLGVSVDCLVFGVERDGCEWVESTLGHRLRRCILERYDSLGAFPKRLGITGNMLRRWLGGTSTPELNYARNIVAMLDVSVDRVFRRAASAITLERQEQGPREIAAVLAARTLERMASKMLDPVLGECARRAEKISRRRGADTEGHGACRGRSRWRARLNRPI